MQEINFRSEFRLGIYIYHVVEGRTSESCDFRRFGVNYICAPSRSHVVMTSLRQCKALITYSNDPDAQEVAARGEPWEINTLNDFPARKFAQQEPVIVFWILLDYDSHCTRHRFGVKSEKRVKECILASGGIHGDGVPTSP